MFEKKHNHHDQRMMENLCNACEIVDIIVNCGTTVHESVDAELAKFERIAKGVRSEIKMAK